jgi:putative membrane protein insertion efficiency factor
MNHPRHWPRRLLASIVLVYQYAISPRLGRNCRFTPTCSQYAREAILTHGAVRGMGLSLRRLSRCHPFHPGGYDPVSP